MVKRKRSSVKNNNSTNYLTTTDPLLERLGELNQRGRLRPHSGEFSEQAGALTLSIGRPLHGLLRERLQVAQLFVDIVNVPGKGMQMRVQRYSKDKNKNCKKVCDIASEKRRKCGKTRRGARRRRVINDGKTLKRHTYFGLSFM